MNRYLERLNYAHWRLVRLVDNCRSAARQSKLNRLE